jgi:hypothetical protein
MSNDSGHRVSSRREAILLLLSLCAPHTCQTALRLAEYRAGYSFLFLEEKQSLQLQAVNSSRRQEAARRLQMLPKRKALS